MKLTTQLLCTGALCLSAFATQAATQQERDIKNRYDAQVSQADADYKSNSSACNGREGNDKDVCMQQAKDTRDKAKADARAERKTASANIDANSDKNAADYKLAKEKCDAMSGDSKDACISDAKLKYRQ